MPTRRSVDMQRYHLGKLLVACVLVALAGCKSTEVKVAPAPSPVNVDLTVGTDSGGYNPAGPEVYPKGLSKGSVVTWTRATQFTITFKTTSPCSNPGDAGKPLQYSSTGSGPYTVTCTIANDPSKTKYKYDIKDSSVAPAILPSKPLGTSGDHCEGCIIDD
jgi:hypothetical protein